MKSLFTAVLVTLSAVSVHAQTYVYDGVTVTGHAWPADASYAVANASTDAKTRASIIPTRLRSNPLAYNYPDSVAYNVLLQPNSDEDGTCATSGSNTLPAMSWTGICTGGVVTSPIHYTATTYTTYAAAISAYDNTYVKIRPFAILTANPTTPATWTVVRPDFVEVCQ